MNATATGSPEAAPAPAEAPWLQPARLELGRTLLISHQRAFGRPLLAASEAQLSERQAAQALFASPVVVLAHDGGSDPRLIYANRAALGLWSHRWDTLIGQPSRLTAAPERQADRQRMLERARAMGAIEGYTGVRIDRHGRRFLIQRARLWTLIDQAGAVRGQAAAFSDWSRIDG